MTRIRTWEPCIRECLEETFGLRAHPLNANERVGIERGRLVNDSVERHVGRSEPANSDSVRGSLHSEGVDTFLNG